MASSLVLVAPPPSVSQDVCSLSSFLFFSFVNFLLFNIFLNIFNCSIIIILSFYYYFVYLIYYFSIMYFTDPNCYCWVAGECANMKAKVGYVHSFIHEKVDEGERESESERGEDGGEEEGKERRSW